MLSNRTRPLHPFVACTRLLTNNSRIFRDRCIPDLHHASSYPLMRKLCRYFQLTRHPPILQCLLTCKLRANKLSYRSSVSLSNALPVISPGYLKLVSKTEKSSDYVPSSQFTQMFRSMSPYITYHRGARIVVHLPGQIIDSPVFNIVMQDLARIHNFGIKLLCVADSRPQLNELLRQRNIATEFHSQLQVTSSEALECAMEAAGAVRFRIESCLGRGIINCPDKSQQIHLASGNFITAQPIGVRNGVDYKYSGEMRRLKIDKIERLLSDNYIVLVSNIGYSASGEVFNCSSEQVASNCAIQLQSEKLIFLHEGEEILDTETNQIVHALSIPQTQQYLQSLEGNSQPSTEFSQYLRESLHACMNGVCRSHIVSRHVDGAILKELFTRDGEGLMISKDLYEGIRAARIEDVGGIMQLIKPLLEEDVLVTRDQEQVEASIHQFYVVERDGAVIACAALQLFEDSWAEMACVAVDPAYRNLGKGNALLGFILRIARSQGVNRVFVLTTRTSHWFLERGFEVASVHDLPSAKKAVLDRKRQSKVYVMDISGKRALDEKELLLHIAGASSK